MDCYAYLPSIVFIADPGIIRLEALYFGSSSMWTPFS